MIRIDFHRLRFLVVDDNAHMRRIVRQLLHGFGSREIYEAEDGASGLEGFTGHNPDILITDWAMPIFDGIELTKTIRQPGGNANPFVPIIMLSGHSEKRRVMEARDAGVTEFLAKPIAAKSLYERVLSVVLNPRPFLQTKAYFGPDRRRNVLSNYAGPERRKGGDGAKIIPVNALDSRLKPRAEAAQRHGCRGIGKVTVTCQNPLPRPPKKRTTRTIRSSCRRTGSRMW
jgi:CheY-like chemotaxis protein